jgi:amidohydrolase
MQMADGSTKQQLQQVVLDHSDDLLSLSHRIHANPEVAFEETQACAWTADVLRANGFTVEQHAGGLPTAFVARAGSGSLHIGICAEYDALAKVGHACGHNIIGAAAVGAALALAQHAAALDVTVTVFGTPAEEGVGGKILMLQRGCFDGIHLAMMVHPAPIERDAMNTLAISQFRVTFTGVAAHASAAPHRGRNAASAMALAQTGIGMLREHLLPTDRVHGVVTHGGDAMNVIPDRVVGEWTTRSRDVTRLKELDEDVFNVFRGAATMTGCTVHIEMTAPTTADVRTDPQVAELWRNNISALGRHSEPVRADDFLAATDMGNVSYAVPSIHPLLRLDCNGANIHEPEFEQCAGSETGDKAVIDGAIAMAWTAHDVANDALLRSRLLLTPLSIDDMPGDGVDIVDA